LSGNETTRFGDDAPIGNPDETERRALLEALARAFRDNPMNIAIHGEAPERRVRANRAGLRALVLDSQAHAARRVIRAEGKVVGGFIAIPPDGFPLPRPRLRYQIGCIWHQGLRAMEQWSQVHFELGQLHPVEPCWYLAAFGVDPIAQGRGLGARLITELGRVVAEQPAPIYLESDREQSICFYRAHGFEEREARVVLGIRCVCLGRGFADSAQDLCDSVRVE
jgi:GNAT superfamily N-acetyltransferase